MTRANASALWDYFDKIGDTKTAICRLCNEEYGFRTTSANLKCHLRRRHHKAYLEVHAKTLNALRKEATNENGETVVYEYTVAGSPTSAGSNDDDSDSNVKAKSSRTQLSDSLSSARRPERRQRIHRIPYSRPPKGGAPIERRLIEKLTEEKINLTIAQKELIQNQLEEKSLKLEILQGEKEHQLQEQQHKKQMQELEKQEMLLKIEILQANLAKLKGPDKSLEPIETD